jgi:hypothetical protein
MENKTQIKDVELPFFYGFYNTQYENEYDVDEAIEHEMDYHNRELGQSTVYGDFEFDSNSYRNTIVECFVHTLENHLPDWVEAIENPELWSPRYYNFQTDKIYVTLILTDDWKNKVVDFFEENAEWLRKRIKEDWTSRSGFTSFMENDYDLFLEHTMCEEPLYISTILQYAIELNTEDLDIYGYDMYDLITDETLENFYERHSYEEFVYLQNVLKENDTNIPNQTETTPNTDNEATANHV